MLCLFLTPHTGGPTQDASSTTTAEILFSHVGFQELTDCICVCNIIKRLVKGKYRSTYLVKEIIGITERKNEKSDCWTSL